MQLVDARRLLAPHLGSGRRRPFAVHVYRAHLLQQMADYGITAIWTPGERGLAFPREMRIVCPPIVDERTVATAAHEGGHCLAERCGGPEHHEATGCLKCEVLAWAFAIALVRPYAWTARMHRHLMYALGTYRRTTPAYAAVKQAADDLATPETWYRLRASQTRDGPRRIDVCRARLAAAMKECHP